MKINLTIPDDVAQMPTFSRADWLREIALSLFEQEQISLGMASQIAGMHSLEFQKYLGGRGGCIHYDLREFEEDVQNLQSRGWL
jgi:predicted HTH domain antitoxin